MAATLGLGWLIWGLVLAGNGQTPAKRIMRLQVVDAETLQPIGLARMFWVRGVVGDAAAILAYTLSLGVLLAMPLWDRHNRTFHDWITRTYVARIPRGRWAGGSPSG